MHPVQHRPEFGWGQAGSACGQVAVQQEADAVGEGLLEGVLRQPRGHSPCGPLRREQPVEGRETSAVLVVRGAVHRLAAVRRTAWVPGYNSTPAASNACDSPITAAC